MSLALTTVFFTILTFLSLFTLFGLKISIQDTFLWIDLEVSKFLESALIFKNESKEVFSFYLVSLILQIWFGNKINYIE